MTKIPSSSLLLLPSHKQVLYFFPCGNQSSPFLSTVNFVLVWPKEHRFFHLPDNHFLSIRNDSRKNQIKKKRVVPFILSFKATLTLFHHSTTTTFVTFFSSTKPMERSYQTVLKGTKSISKYLLKIKILIDSTDTLDTTKHSDQGKMDTLHTSKHTDQGKIQQNHRNISFVLLFLSLVLFFVFRSKTYCGFSSSF